MSKFTNPLDNIKIASPCSQDWDQMIGVGRKRYCAECKLNVYNLSQMTRQEAEGFLMNSEGRLCVRFYRRQDGTILTQDCPVGWQAVKKSISKTVAAFVSLIFGLLSGIGFLSYFDNQKRVIGEMIIGNSSNKTIKPNNSNLSIMMGNIAFEEKEDIEVMGKMVIEKPMKKKSSRK
jgi:hypothetical protein